MRPEFARCFTGARGSDSALATSFIVEAEFAPVNDVAKVVAAIYLRNELDIVSLPLAGGGPLVPRLVVTSLVSLRLAAMW